MSERARWGGSSGRFCLFLASEAPEVDGTEEGGDQTRRMQSLPVWIEGGGGRAHSELVSIAGGGGGFRLNLSLEGSLIQVSTVRKEVT